MTLLKPVWSSQVLFRNPAKSLLSVSASPSIWLVICHHSALLPVAHRIISKHDFSMSVIWGRKYLQGDLQNSEIVHSWTQPSLAALKPRMFQRPHGIIQSSWRIYLCHCGWCKLYKGLKTHRFTPHVYKGPLCAGSSTRLCGCEVRCADCLLQACSSVEGKKDAGNYSTKNCVQVSWNRAGPSSVLRT